MPNDEIVDKTTEDVSDKTSGSSTGGVKPAEGDAVKDAAADVKAADSSGKTPAKLEDVLEKYGLGGAEDLDDFVSNLTTLKEKIGAEDVEELLANKKELRKIQAELTRAEEAKLRETETPEETIQRLESQLHKQQEARRQEDLAKQRAAEDAKLIKSFNGYVSRSVEGLDGYTQAESKFLKKYLGVNNPIHDVELTDTTGIKKLITAAAKDFDKLKEAIISNYEKNGRKGPGNRSADDLPPTPEMNRGVEPGTSSAKEPKNMREARTIAKKQLFDALLRR